MLTRKKKVRKTYSNEIESVKIIPFENRNKKIMDLSYTLIFLPEDMQAEFKQRIEDLKKYITEEEEQYKTSVDSSLTSFEGIEGMQTIKCLNTNKISNCRRHRKDS